MAIALLFGLFALLLMLGVPVAFALAAAALATLLYLDVPTIVLVQQISAGTGSASPGASIARVRGRPASWVSPYQ